MKKTTNQPKLEGEVQKRFQKFMFDNLGKKEIMPAFESFLAAEIERVRQEEVIKPKKITYHTCCELEFHTISAWKIHLSAHERENE